jgi:hypothetical protein
MVRILARLVLLGFPFAVTIVPAPAHDLWINHEARRNTAGEWCCGDGDCAIIDGSAIHITPAGYVVRGYGTLSFSDPSKQEREWIVDTVPFAEAQPSPDGAYWRCKRPDGSRRCFFAPPPRS